MDQSPIVRARQAAKEVFGYPALRPFQEEVFSRLFAGNDLFIVAATGQGKTAAFGIPALVLDGLTVVISPLIALMKSQVDAYDKLGISVCRLTGDMPDSYIREALRDLTQFNLVFVSPEKATTKEFLKALKGVEVALIACDEAHAVASLYSTFRASCAHLGDLYNAHPEAIRLACTATADPHIEEDVRRVCHLRNAVRIVSSPWRENITWDFVKDASESELVELVDDYQSKEGRQIVYVSSRQAARDISTTLSNAGLSSSYYHAGMSPNLRRSVQDQFMRGDVRCVVATSAFGMGIDVADVRLVANWQLPSSLFDLAQQGGRASRDGAPALCWTNLGANAEKTQRYFLLLGNPPWRVYRKLWDAFSRQEGPQRWRGDVLLRVAGVGDKLAGHLSSAMSYLEFRRQIRTAPAGEVYVLQVKDKVRAARLVSAVRGARMDKDHVIYPVPRGTVDQSSVFTSNGACYSSDPVESVVVTRLVDELQITPDDIADREARAEDNLEAIYEFAAADDKKAYLESVMSK